VKIAALCVATVIGVREHIGGDIEPEVPIDDSVGAGDRVDDRVEDRRAIGVVLVLAEDGVALADERVQ
jgi:hypothetical protein